MDGWAQSVLVSLRYYFRVEVIPSMIPANFELQKREIPTTELGSQSSQSGGKPISREVNFALRVGDNPSSGVALAEGNY